MLSYFGISTRPVLLVFPMQYILIFSDFENSSNLLGLFVEIIIRLWSSPNNQLCKNNRFSLFKNYASLKNCFFFQKESRNVHICLTRSVFLFFSLISIYGMYVSRHRHRHRYIQKYGVSTLFGFPRFLQRLCIHSQEHRPQTCLKS